MKNSKLIFFIVILLIVVCLSGCQKNSDNDGDQHNTDNKFIGDWEIVNSSPDYETWSFYTNGSAKNILTQELEGQSMTTIAWFDYTKDNSNVCFSPKNESVGSSNYFSECFVYNFFDNTTRLTLSSNDIIIMNLVRIS
ncbi:Uncharacterised protein [uncultured archaeon]|nr:Uncharacterised protein [uncultured archaeon]